jgi:chemotaxis protein MotB
MSSRTTRPRVNHERWLVSYADFITLLFAFFVVLYAFAKADQKKQAQVSSAIDSAFQSLGVFPDGTQSPAAGTKIMSFEASPAAQSARSVDSGDAGSIARARGDLEQIRSRLQQSLSLQIADNSVSIRMSREGLVISLREAGFFDSGSAIPKPASLQTLHRIADALVRTPYNVRVEGHTDNVAIHNSQFDSNWELSSARAIRIARQFLEFGAIAPDRMSVAGYGQFHPVADNDSVDGRAKNRRVDLVVLPQSAVNFNAPQVKPTIGDWRKISDD